MSHSLRNQINFAINQNWNENTQKRNYKLENGNQMAPQVFSYSEAFRLKDVGKDFSNFINKEYSHIKQIKCISPTMIQRFLNTKENCSKQTISTYYNSLKKVDLLLAKTYKTYESKFIDIVKPLTTQSRTYNTGRGVANQIPQEHLNKILSYCKDHPCQSSHVIRLQNFLGIRVNELTHGLKIANVNFDKMELTLTNTKGGKVLTRPLTQESSSLLKEIISQKYDTKGQNLFTIQNNSVNRFLSRTEDTLGIDGKYSIHNIRSRVAQNYFDNLRNNGMSKVEALKATSLFLNHRSEREQMLTQSYIHIW